VSGKKGRSGRKPNGARALAFTPEMPVPQTETPPVPASVVEGLQHSGRAFVGEMWAHYADWSPDAMALLREAGGVVDALADYQAVLAAEGRVIVGPRGGTLLHPAVRPQAQAVRSLALLVKALGLQEEE